MIHVHVHDQTSHDPKTGQFTAGSDESTVHPHEAVRKLVQEEANRTLGSMRGNSDFYRTLIYKHSPELHNAQIATKNAEQTAREARVSPESDLEPRVMALINEARAAKVREDKLYREIANHALPPDRLKNELKKHGIVIR